MTRLAKLSLLARFACINILILFSAATRKFATVGFNDTMVFHLQDNTDNNGVLSKFRRKVTILRRLMYLERSVSIGGLKKQ